MIVSINQPAYLPWLGYFDRIIKSDIHVILDHVQYEKNSMVNRNKIRTKQGSTLLTVPVLTKGKFGDLSIDSLEIDQKQRWNKKHFSAIQQSYSKAPHYNKYAHFLEELFFKDWNSFIDLTKTINDFIFQELDITTKIIYSSEMEVQGEKSELVLNICKNLGTKTYISGPFGRDYLDKDSFSNVHIDIEYHDYKHPEYNQIHGSFEPYMCIFDLLFNHGTNARSIITQ